MSRGAASSSRKVYVSRVTVQCTSVPYDMMRYDNCVPATEEDSHKLERIANHSASPEDRTVVFRRYSVIPNGPTEARWPGFGGKVLSWEWAT